MTARYIAIDWGSTNLRAWLYQGDHCLESRQSEAGVTRLNGKSPAAVLAEVTTDWREEKNGYNGLVGVTYDFDVAKLYVTGEYNKHMRIKASDNTTATGMAGAFKDWSMNTGYIDGYAATIGADVPAFGGVLKVDFGYRYGECVVNNANDYKQYSAVGYQYDLTKRTTLYTAASYTKADLGKIHGTHADDDSLAAIEVFGGMVHRF